MQHTHISFDEAFEMMSDLLDGFTPEQIEKIKDNATLHTYKKNEIIYDCGEHPTYMYCLLQGKVKLSRKGYGDKTTIVQVINPIQCFGYSAAIIEIEHLNIASAFETCTLARLPMHIMMPMIKSNPTVAWKFIISISKHLGVVLERSVNMMQKRIQGRLADTLIFMRDSYGYEEDGCTLAVTMSREDIACLSNMTTSNVIRTLSLFASDELIMLEKKRIKILDEDALVRISEYG